MKTHVNWKNQSKIKTQNNRNYFRHFYNLRFCGFRYFSFNKEYFAGCQPCYLWEICHDLYFDKPHCCGRGCDLPGHTVPPWSLLPPGYDPRGREPVSRSHILQRDGSEGRRWLPALHTRVILRGRRTEHAHWPLRPWSVTSCSSYLLFQVRDKAGMSFSCILFHCDKYNPTCNNQQQY